MEKNSNLEKKFYEILNTGNFDELHLYQEIDGWKSMTARERELLATLFVMQGETLLKKGDSQAQNSFDLATQVACQDPRICYLQAKAYASRIGNVRCLLSALQALQIAVNLNPSYFEAWSLWGGVLVHLGNLHQDPSYFQEANDKFTKALSFSSSVTSALFSELYAHWGRCYYFLGKLSGEACDFRTALDKYRQAAELGMEEGFFWNDYGDAILELNDLIGKGELLFEATEMYRKATHYAVHDYKGWFNLACAYQRLYEFTFEEEYFHAAHESFERSVDLRPEDGILWYNWAQLFANAGKLKWDLEKIQISFEKFEKADHFETNHPLIISHWGEAEMLFGAAEEKVGFLRAAEAKLLRSLELDPDSSHIWYLYGTCLNELGCYFEDERYYWQAIEKLRYGITLKDNDPLLWYALSLAHFAIGDLNNDEGMLEKSISYCCRVMEFGGSHSSQFWNDWGISCMRLGELTQDCALVEQALEKFMQALNINDEELTHEIIEPEWLYNYGCALDLLGDFTENIHHYEKAIEAFTRALELDPIYLHARFNLALAYSHLAEATADVDHYCKSLEQFERLVQEDSEDEMAWNEWGVTLLNLGLLIYDETHPEKSYKIYLLAENKINHAIALGGIHAFYTAAGLYSTMQNYPVALHFLERAEMAGALPPIDDLMHDDWLEGLRETPSFHAFITHLTNKYEKEKP